MGERELDRGLHEGASDLTPVPVAKKTTQRRSRARAGVGTATVANPTSSDPSRAMKVGNAAAASTYSSRGASAGPAWERSRHRVGDASAFRTVSPPNLGQTAAVSISGAYAPERAAPLNFARR
jgi:hypothetical protein